MTPPAHQRHCGLNGLEPSRKGQNDFQPAVIGQTTPADFFADRHRPSPPDQIRTGKGVIQALPLIGSRRKPRVMRGFVMERPYGVTQPVARKDFEIPFAVLHKLRKVGVIPALDEVQIADEQAMFFSAARSGQNFRPQVPKERRSNDLVGAVERRRLGADNVQFGALLDREPRDRDPSLQSSGFDR